MSEQRRDGTGHARPGGHAGHEKRDFNLRGVVVFAILLAIICVASGAAMLAVFRYLDNRLVQSEAPVSPMALPAGQQPPEPRLLTNEPANLAAFQREQHEQITTYGWVDKPAGIVHMPVERAKAILLERGLPSR
jgi:hypothetical protein